MRRKALGLLILLAMMLGLQTGTMLQAEATAFMQDTLPAIEAAAWLDLEGVENARQLGGYPTRSGGTVSADILLRTGELADMTDTDMALLASNYQLAHIIDLRDEIEADAAPDTKLEGVQYHHLNVWPRAVRQRLIAQSTTNQQLDSALYVQNYYAAFALEPAAVDAYRAMFQILLENEEGSVLIHCVHGKDRTGIAAALILTALDVDWSTAEQEYLLSNVTYDGSVDISSLRHYLKVIEENYGSIGDYLEVEMGLDAESLQTLRDKYTTYEPQAYKESGRSIHLALRSSDYQQSPGEVRRGREVPPSAIKSSDMCGGFAQIS